MFFQIIAMFLLNSFCAHNFKNTTYNVNNEVSRDYESIVAYLLKENKLIKTCSDLQKLFKKHDGEIKEDKELNSEILKTVNNPKIYVMLTLHHLNVYKTEDYITFFYYVEFFKDKYSYKLTTSMLIQEINDVIEEDLNDKPIYFTY
ncbi:hypothetical protein TUBRATIS_31030 [Tubulinosema ratisbonensis]|uniref:Uncharacterized protein n=1 Tax=Tubulinosema ratisbonensis TaxID=291195 RepID=A0A437AH30_9MICR|nr:hypothetical protein TUBRATIS_31030 [Tubulinosema ratisbonensis]